jgi:hypothetical protein
MSGLSRKTVENNENQRSAGGHIQRIDGEYFDRQTTAL